MKIAIAGYGLEGISNYSYFSTRGDVTIVDERTEVVGLPEGVKTILGPSALTALADFDMVVRTAGIPPHKITTKGKVWSATNEFFAKCPAPIIGVTGSKGKGTTASLIASILRAAGNTVHLIGNIGVPALDVLERVQPKDIVVYELSSFQLWDLEKSPNVAVLLYIEPDHLEVHADMQEYVGAKANIRLRQTAADTCFYHPTNTYVQQIISMDAGLHNDTSRAQRAVPYNDKIQSNPEIDFAYRDVNNFVIQRKNEMSTVSFNELRIPGIHNQENACAAIDAALVFGVSDDQIKLGLNEFTGLPHRLKLVKEIKGVQYYDDSIATTPGSAIAAMRAFQAPKIMILGGSSKGADFDELAQVASSTNIKHVVLIGDESQRLAGSFAQTEIPVTNLGTTMLMPQIVQTAAGFAVEGDVVILTPACASFGMFKNYSDRGDQFISAVNGLEASV